MALLWLPGAARAGGFHNADIGVRRMGMFASVARPDDLSAMFHNPAGLVLMEGTQFYHSQSWFFVDLGMRMYDSHGDLHPDYEIHPDWNIGFIPFIGLASDLGTERFRFGVAAYSPNAYGAMMPEDEPSRYHATQVLFLGSRASATVAWEVTDKFAIAANANIVHMYLTATRMMNPLVLQDPDRRFDPPEVTAPFDSKLELDGQGLAWSADFGVLFQPLKTLKLGAMFSGGADTAVKGDITLTGPDGKKTETQHRTMMVIPYTMQVGVNWEFAPDFEIGADYRYYHYQVLQEQVSKLDDPVMGMNEFADPKNYGNSGNWCVGILYHVTPAVEVMFGYQEDYTPIPNKTYSLENPSRDQIGISGGIRWQALERHRFGLALIRNWFDLVDVQESLTTPPTNVKGHGSTVNLGLDYTWKL
jgi:long-subunit fatty acid transport protein